jgi:uncharacterized protein
MQRILFWLGIILLVNWWVRRQSRAAAGRVHARREQAGMHQASHPGAARSGMPPGANGSGAAAPARQLAEPMARCDTCGVHIPQSESLTVGGGHFCCAEHVRESVHRGS